MLETSAEPQSPEADPKQVSKFTPEQAAHFRRHFAALREADYDKECWLVAVQLPKKSLVQGFRDYVELLHFVHHVRRNDTYSEMWGAEPSEFLVRLGAVLHAAAKGSVDGR